MRWSTVCQDLAGYIYSINENHCMTWPLVLLATMLSAVALLLLSLQSGLSWVVQLTKVWLWTDSFVNPLMCTTWRYVSSPNHGITGENHPRRVYRRPEFETHFEGRCVVPCAMAMHRWLSLFTNIILLYTFISNKPHWTCHCHNYWGGWRFCPHRCLQHRKLQRIRCQVNWQVWDQYLINKGIDGPHRVRDRF